MDRRLIDHFVNANLISRQDMQRIILRASKDKTTFVEEMLAAQLVHEDTVAQHIAAYYKKETLNAQTFRVDPMALNLITGDIAKRGNVLPYSFSDAQDRLMVALFDPEGSVEVINILEKTTGVPAEIYFAPKSWVVEAIEHYYFRPQDNASSPPRTARKTNAKLRSTFVGERSRPRKTNNLSNSFDGAIDDLDDFLSEQPRSTTRASQVGARSREVSNPSFGDMSGLGPGFWEDPSSSKWNWGENSQSPQSNSSSKPQKDFDLFAESEATDHQDQTLQAIVERQHEKIVKLNDELKRQRDVIQVLADLLIEARVISARELKKRVKDKRK